MAFIADTVTLPQPLRMQFNQPVLLVYFLVIAHERPIRPSSNTTISKATEAAQEILTLCPTRYRHVTAHIKMVTHLYFAFINAHTTERNDMGESWIQVHVLEHWNWQCSHNQSITDLTMIKLFVWQRRPVKIITWTQQIASHHWSLKNVWRRSWVRLYGTQAATNWNCRQTVWSSYAVW